MIAIPIPLALSRVKMALKNAKATNTTEIKHPIIIIIKPTESGELISSGIPAPTKNAKTIEIESPKTNSTIFFSFDWLTQ